MKKYKIISLIILTSFISCKKEDIIITPTYMSIENIILDENSSHNITDAWVYINDNLQGVYELPANFPILATGKQKLRVRAGVKDNGISATRIPYPFYSSYIIEELEFQEDTTILITPTVKYLEDIIFNEHSEDFDGNGLNLEIDSTTFSIENTESLDGNYGVITLSDSILSAEVTTQEIESLPQEGANIYLELDYKCDTEFLIGTYVNFPQLSVLKKELVWITPKEDWNKIYVNLTTTISEAVGAESFKIFIAMQRDFTMDKNTIDFDNFKLVY